MLSEENLNAFLAGRTITSVYVDSEVTMLTLDDGTLVEFEGAFRFTCVRQ